MEIPGINLIRLAGRFPQLSPVTTGVRAAAILGTSFLGRAGWISALLRYRWAALPLIFALACRNDKPEFQITNGGREDAGLPDDRDGSAPRDSGARDGSPADSRRERRLDGMVSRDAGIGERGVTLGDPDRILIRGGVIVTADEGGLISTIVGGALLVNGDTIDCVSEGSCSGTAGATVVQLGSNDKVYPGLIDTHNHPHYNFCPVFEHSRIYEHNGQWRGSAEYAEWGDTYYDPNDSLVCEKYWYGLATSLFGGATAIQGIGINRRCLRQGEDEPLLGRMLDSMDGLGPDHVRTWALGIDAVPDEDAQSFCDGVDDGEEDRVFIHIGEGRRGNENVEEEFDTLRNLANGCLVDPARAGALVFIHGNFTEETLGAIAALGESPEERPTIVWSPSSNTDLYGWNEEATLSVPDAIALGIRVALGPDWRPSRGIGMMTEINLARTYAAEFFPAGAVTDEDLFRMATVDAAHAAGLEDDIGRLATGRLADIALIKGGTDNPFEAATLGDVAGVMIGGRFYYGDDWLMAATSLDSGLCEELEVCGVAKRICIPNAVTGESVSFSTLESGTFVYSAAGGESSYSPVPFDSMPLACGPE